MKKILSPILSELRSLRRGGYRFTIYVCEWRGRRHLAEISATCKIPGGGIRGLSWQSPINRQDKLRRYENGLKVLKIPIRYR